MNDALVVRGAQRVERLVGDGEHIVDRKRAAGAEPSRLEVLALEQIEDEECAAVLRDAVVLDMDDAGVTDGVRDVTLTEEARARALVARELGMEHLQRGLVAVAMGRGIHGGHTARADALVDVPLAVDHGADAGRPGRTRTSTRGSRRLAH